jgi:hypothetical protein
MGILVILGITLIASISFAQRPKKQSRAKTNPAESQCVTGYGRTACGFSCVKAYGDVQCAQTPWGRCAAAYGRVVCGDPLPPQGGFSPIPGRFGRIGRIPPVQCESAYGMTACGYDCKAAYGVVRCAQSPWGRCLAQGGQVICSDPSAWGFFPGAVEDGGSDYKCHPTQGGVVCGYNCIQAPGGRVHCSQTPYGVCQSTFGLRVKCWDPAPEALDQSQVAEQARCLSAYGKTECGYGCKAAYGEVACSDIPGGKCEAAYGKVTCAQMKSIQPRP